MEIQKTLLTFAHNKDRYFFSQIQKYIIKKLPIFLTLDEAKNWLQANILGGTVTVGNLIDLVAPTMVNLKVKNPALGRPRKHKE